MSKEEKKARKTEKKAARKAEKKARWESLTADLDHVRKENARLSSKLEQLRSVIALPTCASSEILHDVTTILNEEPEESSSEVQEEEEEDDRLEKIVESWDNEELVGVFWEFVNDQGIESDFMEYSRNVAKVRNG